MPLAIDAESYAIRIIGNAMTRDASAAILSENFTHCALAHRGKSQHVGPKLL